LTKANIGVRVLIKIKSTHPLASPPNNLNRTGYGIKNESHWGLESELGLVEILFTRVRDRVRVRGTHPLALLPNNLNGTGYGIENGSHLGLESGLGLELVERLFTRFRVRVMVRVGGTHPLASSPNNLNGTGYGIENGSPLNSNLASWKAKSIRSDGSKKRLQLGLGLG
jgi:hypothetical protein